MKNQFLLLLLLLGMLSCKKSDKAEEINKETTFLNDKWDRIRIPDGGQVQAVAGSIDDTLVVSTLYNTYLVTKKGTAFTLTSRHLNNTPGLYVIKEPSMPSVVAVMMLNLKTIMLDFLLTIRSIRELLGILPLIKHRSTYRRVWLYQKQM